MRLGCEVQEEEGDGGVTEHWKLGEQDVKADRCCGAGWLNADELRGYVP